MAKIINVEKSQYLNDNIEIYTGNKVGQYSKFLDKNPLFITYFHINEVQTRTDVGTGGIKSDLGPASPIRFNQINNLPAYNIPDLKPDVEYGENGYDIEMELSDVVLLPNTIKPMSGDYILIVLPNTIEFLFRVNGFGYNTIQSNDYYTFSADLKHTGHNLISKLQSQIVDVYETIFENIGTDDKCFILQQDVKKIQNIGKLFLEVRDSYYNNFFDTQTGAFVCKNNDVTPMNDAWYYDKYVEKFIMDSGIYYTENDEHSIILNCCDLETPDMNTLFMQTLQYAVLNHTIDYLSSHMYGYQVGIQKRFSPFIIYHLNCKGINLVITKDELVPNHSDALDCGLMHEYFHHDLIRAIKGEPEPVFPEEPEEEIPEIPDENPDGSTDIPPVTDDSDIEKDENTEENTSNPEQNNPDDSGDTSIPEETVPSNPETETPDTGETDGSDKDLENGSDNESGDTETTDPDIVDTPSDNDGETNDDDTLLQEPEEVVPEIPETGSPDTGETTSDESVSDNNDNTDSVSTNTETTEPDTEDESDTNESNDDLEDDSDNESGDINTETPDTEEIIPDDNVSDNNKEDTPIDGDNTDESINTDDTENDPTVDEGNNDNTEDEDIIIDTEIPEGGESVIPQEPIEPDTEEPVVPEETITEYETDFYLDKIIYQYLTNRMLDIDRKQLIPYMLKVDNYTYMMMPLVMYVIMKYYDSYFEKTEL